MLFLLPELCGNNFKLKTKSIQELDSLRVPVCVCVCVCVCVEWSGVEFIQ